MTKRNWVSTVLAAALVVIGPVCAGSGNGVLTDGAVNGTSDAGVVDPPTSPGTVTLKLEITSAMTYCQQAECGPSSSITIKDSTGKVVGRDFPGCGTAPCESCQPTGCPGFACQPQGYAVTGETLTWDGTTYAASTCGAAVQCARHVYVKPGAYVAVMCAIPGTLAGDANGVKTCTPTGTVKCVEVPFQFPSSQPVVGAL